MERAGIQASFDFKGPAGYIGDTLRISEDSGGGEAAVPETIAGRLYVLVGRLNSSPGELRSED